MVKSSRKNDIKSCMAKSFCYKNWFLLSVLVEIIIFNHCIAIDIERIGRYCPFKYIEISFDITTMNRVYKLIIQWWILSSVYKLTPHGLFLLIEMFLMLVSIQIKSEWSSLLTVYRVGILKQFFSSSKNLFSKTQSSIKSKISKWRRLCIP